MIGDNCTFHVDVVVDAYAGSTSVGMDIYPPELPCIYDPNMEMPEGTTDGTYGVSTGSGGTGDAFFSFVVQQGSSIWYYEDEAQAIWCMEPSEFDLLKKKC
jgi:hypothetical protein